MSQMDLHLHRPGVSTVRPADAKAQSQHHPAHSPETLVDADALADALPTAPQVQPLIMLPAHDLTDAEGLVDALACVMSIEDQLQMQERARLAAERREDMRRQYERRLKEYKRKLAEMRAAMEAAAEVSVEHGGADVEGTNGFGDLGHEGGAELPDGNAGVAGQPVEQSAPVAPAYDPPPMQDLPDPLAHRTDFLEMHVGDQRFFTHEYFGLSPEKRAEVRAALHERGYTHLYAYVANEGDYGGNTRFNFYERPEELRVMLKELVDDGIAPVLWLMPDDSDGLLAKYPPTHLAETWKDFIPKVDDLVSSYVLGLESNEYWKPEDEKFLGRSLDALTDKPIFVHQTPGEWELAREPWASGIIYQYGFGQSDAQIEERTRGLSERMHALGKVFVAGEYAVHDSEEHARHLGDVAMHAGADGYGNGGTVQAPRGNVTAAEATETAHVRVMNAPGQIQEIMVDGQPIFGGNTGGYYIIGSPTGGDERPENPWSIGTPDGVHLVAPDGTAEIPFRMQITGENPMRVRVEVGPLPRAMSTLSVPMDLGKQLFTHFAFSRGGIRVSDMRNESRSSGEYASLTPRWALSDGSRVGNAVLTGVRPGDWLEASTAGGLRVRRTILDSNATTMIAFNHPGTNNLEIAWSRTDGKIPAGRVLFLEEEITFSM